MENSVEQKIVNYECNLLKQAFFNSEVLMFLRSKIPENFFQNQIREVLWRTFLFINDNGEELSRSTVEDVFISSNNASHIDKVWFILETQYPDEGQWKYHFRYLFEVYAKSNILLLTHEIQKKLKSDSVKAILDYISTEILKYDPREDEAIAIDDAAAIAMREIIDRRSGKISPFIRTGNERFDNLAKIDFNEIVLFAAAKKIGKTKFSLHLIMEMLEIDPSIAVRIYSFELSEKEVMYEFISREAQLKSSEIQSKNYILSDEEIDRIKTVSDKITKLDITISTKPVSIETIKKEFTKFCREKNTNRAILVIDNIGLLKEGKGTQTEIDDHIAKMLVEIRDKTKALIIPIHHMTKDMEKEDRLKDGYRPRLEHLKGSTRIQDYANKVILFHRPGHYDDLVAKETAKGVIQLSNGKFSRGELIRKLFIAEVALNRNGDKGVVRFLHRLQFCQFKEWR